MYENQNPIDQEPTYEELTEARHQLRKIRGAIASGNMGIDEAQSEILNIILNPTNPQTNLREKWENSSAMLSGGSRKLDVALLQLARLPGSYTRIDSEIPMVILLSTAPIYLHKAIREGWIKKPYFAAPILEDSFPIDAKIPQISESEKGVYVYDDQIGRQI